MRTPRGILAGERRCDLGSRREALGPAHTGARVDEGVASPVHDDGTRPGPPRVVGGDRGERIELPSTRCLDDVLGVCREHGRIVRDVGRQVATLGALVLHAERHLEAEQDEQRHPEIAEQQPPRHGTRSRKPTPRTVSIQPGSPELPPQRGDVDVDRLRGAVPARLPDLGQQPLPADGGARIARERGQQLELLGRQLELAAAQGRAPGALVDLELADPQRTAGAVERRRAPRDRADPGDQLAQPVRLDDVVVGPELEPHDPVCLLAAGGEDDDRHPRALAELPADVEAVDVRQAQVEQDEVRGRSLEGAFARSGARDVVALPPQPGHERVGNGVLVFDDQDVHIPSVVPRRPLGIRV